MRLSLKIKFVLYISLLVAMILGVVGFVVVRYRIQEITTDLEERDQIIGTNIAGQLSEYLADFYYLQFDTFSTLIQRIYTTYPDMLHIRIVNIEGKILFDSSEITEGKYSKETDRVFSDQEALARIQDATPSYSFTTFEGKRVLEVEAPYIDKYGVHRTSVEFYFSLQKIQDATKKTIQLFTLLLGGFLAFATFSVLILVTQITKPILGLKRGAQEVSKGNLDYVVDIKTKDELDDLANSFNHMAQDLKKSRADLEEYNRTLERQVADRTKELEIKISDLERMEKIAVGRELKMVELKKQVEELQKGVGVALV